MPSQRPFFLSSFFTAFRQQPPSLTAAAPQPNKHTHPHATTQSSSGSSPYGSSSTSPQSRTISTSSPSHPQGSTPATTSSPPPPRTGSAGGVMNQLQPLHSPRPIPTHRRGSDSSSEGFRDVLGADKWYIGGRTAAGEEKFFKLGVVKRARSQDRLSLDRLSL
ncbi:hypothetical protein SAMD00023353_1801730 [Rosellinia necatrix]|uniref:Uncharacterized protein n=1 Tax=Rosellinia necatrix TaxID=77044 RepID=A0A1W2TE20_ROSNE|nr:hypothetical protein SAMD00023353_1801730 [Rosellinia necatrix]